MPIDTTSFWEQVCLGEDSDLELKEVQFRGKRISAPRRENLADELAAFANSGGGRLVLGISDERQPQSLEPKQLDALVKLVTDICSDSGDRRWSAATGSLQSQRTRPPDRFNGRQRHLVVSRDGGLIVRVRLPVHRTQS